MSEPEVIQTPAGSAALRRSRRRTLAISVLPNGDLELAAPLDAEEAAILARVEKRAGWIERQRRAFREMNAARPPPRYVTGATHRYLGRQYRLKVERGEKTGVALRGGYFQVTVCGHGEAAVREALEAWLRQRAGEQFAKRLQGWCEWCRNRRLPTPRLQLLRMAKRWGSARKNGTIALNPELIRAPSACIDYVITHEICHLKHPDHGPKFRALLQQLCPDWRRLKERLEGLE
jgi:predicted metal-dependent hydrolase